MSATKITMDTTDTTATCNAEIIRIIERSLRKGCVEGVIFNPCLSCESSTITAKTLMVPQTRISISGSGVHWKTYGYSEAKVRK